MKKILFLTILLFTIKAASAQRFFGARRDFDESYRPRFGFAVAAAFSNAVPASTNNFIVSGITGFSLGLTHHFPVGDNLVIGSELLYAERGYKANTPAGEYTQRSHFIDIPVVAKYYFKKIDIYAGPQYSYLLSAPNTYDNNFVVDERPYYDYNGPKSFFAAVAGLGYSINESVDVNARYVIDIKGRSANGSIRIPNYRIQYFQIAFGIKF